MKEKKIGGYLAEKLKELSQKAVKQGYGRSVPVWMYEEEVPDMVWRWLEEHI